MVYYYDRFGWLSDTPIPGRETDVVPMQPQGNKRPNFTGYKWILQEYVKPVYSPLDDTTSIAIWRARAVLKKKGLFDQIDSYITANKDVNIELYEVWNYGNFIDRNSMLIQILAPMFNLTEQQVDELFTEALNIIV